MILTIFVCWLSLIVGFVLGCFWAGRRGGTDNDHY